MSEYIGSDQTSGLEVWRRADGTVSLEWPENKGPRYVLLQPGQWRALMRIAAAAARMRPPERVR